MTLTRTKIEIILFVLDKGSMFSEELLTDNQYLMTSGNGKTKLIVRVNLKRNNIFLGCSNYPSCLYYTLVIYR